KASKLRLTTSASLHSWRCYSIGQTAGPDQKCRVGVHAVLGTGGQSLDLPVADQRLPSAWFGKALQLAQAFHDLHQLRDRGHIGHKYPAWDEQVAYGFQMLPRHEHVQDDAVDGAAEVFLGHIA